MISLLTNCKSPLLQAMILVVIASISSLIGAEPGR